MAWTNTSTADASAGRQQQWQGDAAKHPARHRAMHPRGFEQRGIESAQRIGEQKERQRRRSQRGHHDRALTRDDVDGDTRAKSRVQEHVQHAAAGRAEPTPAHRGEQRREVERHHHQPLQRRSARNSGDQRQGQNAADQHRADCGQQAENQRVQHHIRVTQRREAGARTGHDDRTKRRQHEQRDDNGYTRTEYGFGARQPHCRDAAPARSAQWNRSSKCRGKSRLAWT